MAYRLTVDALNRLIEQMDAQAEAIAALKAEQARTCAELVRLNEQMQHGIKVQTVVAL